MYFAKLQSLKQLISRYPYLFSWSLFMNWQQGKPKIRSFKFLVIILKLLYHTQFLSDLRNFGHKSKVAHTVCTVREIWKIIELETDIAYTVWSPWLYYGWVRLLTAAYKVKHISVLSLINLFSLDVSFGFNCFFWMLNLAQFWSVVKGFAPVFWC